MRVVIYTLVFVFLFPALALAADGVDVTPLVNQVIMIAVTILTVIAGVVSKFITSWFASKTKMEDSAFEALAAERINTILHHAISYAEAYAKREVNDPESGLQSVKIDNFFIRTAVGYAINSMSGENSLMRIFNLTEERIKDMILTRLNDRIEVKLPPA